MVYIASAFAVMAALASFALSTYLFNANGIQAIILGTLVFAFIAVGAIVIVLLRQFSRDTLRIFAHFARAYPDLAKHIDPLKDREEES